jgi:hypothetical protein
MNKLIFTLTILFISICTFAQTGYKFFPTEYQYWNEATHYTWITGDGDLANPVEITWYWEEQMITIKDLKYPLLKDKVYFIQTTEKTEKDQTLINTTDRSLIMIHVVRKQNLIVMTVMSPDESTPVNEEGAIMIKYGRRYLVPLDKDHTTYIY